MFTSAHSPAWQVLLATASLSLALAILCILAGTFINPALTTYGLYVAGLSLITALISGVAYLARH